MSEVTLVAVDNPDPDDCLGCVFYTAPGCRAPNIPEFWCLAGSRTDGREILWVLKQEANHD